MKLLTAVCDLQFCPVSFDFVTWLVRAMKARDDAGCNALHVVVIPLEGGRAGFARGWGEHDDAATLWRFWHICVAACPLAGATVTVAASKSQAEALIRATKYDVWWEGGKQHFMGPLVDAARAGESIPKLRATYAARRYVRDWIQRESMRARPLVTLTTRRQTTDPARNSDDAECTKFSDWLLDRQYHLVWLDDTNEALSAGRGYAELDPDLRLALYERAALNLIGNNGPQELLKFSDAPYRVFGVGLGGWADHFRKYFHMQPGDQLPWAGPQQRLIYKPMTFDVVKDEFLQWEAQNRLGG